MHDAPLTANDCCYAIKHTARGKSPGPDGLPAEYYDLFPSQWALVMELVYASQYRKGYFKSYRPLALLNQDAKLGPKALDYLLNHVYLTYSV
ncbi:unnamed protein product [Peronospora farinosa]|uniref:Reverse transcriptase domain-containing protein n=1 Tax=Peronospora farinosa TaxID=134698 RepID=A0AAV0TXY2_9STRA|nr:unnamed protein product [Peronospora farinosa]